MKNIILISATITFLLTINLMASAQDNKHVTHGKKENHKHQNENINSEQESYSEFQKSYHACEKKISKNDKKIAKLKEEKQSKKIEERILALEHKNDELTKKMEGFNADKVKPE